MRQNVLILSGFAERHIHTVKNMFETFEDEYNVPTTMWSDCAQIITHTLNTLECTAVESTPYKTVYEDRETPAFPTDSCSNYILTQMSAGGWISAGSLQEYVREARVHVKESLSKVLKKAKDTMMTVSYTHLTLPTICSV